MNSALHVGRNALLGYQGALQVVGGNISGAGSPDYTRLTPTLSPLPSLGGGELQPGAGVALTDIRRNIDNALENRLRLSTAEVESLTTRQQSLAELETYFDDVSGNGVPTLLAEFFGAFETVGQDPLADRSLAVRKGEELASALSRLRGQIAELGQGLDDQVASLTTEAGDLAGRVADLNARISVAEGRGRGEASGLRDQRDAVLRELGALVDVTVREQPDGVVNVYIGNEALVQGGLSRGLSTVVRVVDGYRRTSVVFADSGSVVQPRGGRLAGLMSARDEEAFGRIASLDEFARALIHEVNRVHADGQGLVGFNEVEGTFRLTRTDVPLDDDATGLSAEVRNGAFHIVMSDGSPGGVRVHVVNVDLDGLGNDDTTLQSLVDQLNGIDHLHAEITPDSRLALSADSGITFTFGHDGQRSRSDTSGVLSALGINTFFTGDGAADIAVNDTLLKNGQWLAASSVNRAGNAGNAVNLSLLLDTAVEGSGDPPIRDRFNTISNDVAVRAGAMNTSVESADGIRSALMAQKESISGVSLDEEAIELVKYERAFQGASRYLGVVDRLIGELMTMLQ